MKYKLTYQHNDSYISYIEVGNKTMYLIPDDNGEDIQELAEPYYNILLWLMNQNSLMNMIESQ